MAVGVLIFKLPLILVRPHRVPQAMSGGGMFTHWGEGTPTPFELIGSIRCPVYGFFGDLDPNPSPTDVDRFERCWGFFLPRWIFRAGNRLNRRVAAG